MKIAHYKLNFDNQFKYIQIKFDNFVEIDTKVKCNLFKNGQKATMMGQHN